MRMLFGLLLMALLAVPMAAEAQGAPPPGSYQRHCRDIRMENIYLHAWCTGSRGSGQSTLNVLSCRTDIGVDPDGGLICGGPDSVGPPPPAYRPPPGGGYDSPAGGGQRRTATLYAGRKYRGPSVQVFGDTPNLDRSGFNDRVGSIRFARRSGAWQVCADAYFRGQCVTVSGDVSDIGRLGLRDAVSSLRPLH